MAILTTIVDDYTGEDPATRTVRMSFDGDYFDLDLSEASYETIKGMFAGLMARGRRTSANSKMRQPHEWEQMNLPSALPNTEATKPEPAQTELDIARSTSSSEPRFGVTSGDLDKETRQIMRKWAQTSGWAERKGIVVPTRGALSQQIIDAYLAVHPMKAKSTKTVK